VWYRTYERGFVLRYKSGKVSEFDETNQVQKAALMSGMAELEACVIPKMRMSWWMGPHRFVDVPTPYPHQEFPYVPFFGFREDRTGIPYGMIRAMRPLQDEVNSRRARMLWQLSAKRVFVDEDATSDHKQLQREIARPDVYAKINTLKGKKTIGDMIHVEDNASLTMQQFQVYQDAAQKLQDAGGVYQQQLGKSGAADSGIAISQLIDQGTTTLAEINDNEQFGRMLVGDRLMALITFDMKGKPETINVKKMGGGKKVKFNNKKTDKETGIPYLENDITRMQMSVVLSELPSTPTYRMQQFMQLTEFAKGLPEQLQVAMMSIIINASDVPEKEQVLKAVRKVLGQDDTDPADMSDDERAQYQAAMQDQQKMKAMQDQLAEATNELQEAKVRLTDAQAELALVQADKIKVESGLNPDLSQLTPLPPINLGIIPPQLPPMSGPPMAPSPVQNGAQGPLPPPSPGSPVPPQPQPPPQ
jgi:hypothetical protein